MLRGASPPLSLSVLSSNKSLVYQRKRTWQADEHVWRSVGVVHILTPGHNGERVLLTHDQWPPIIAIMTEGCTFTARRFIHPLVRISLSTEEITYHCVTVAKCSLGSVLLTYCVSCSFSRSSFHFQRVIVVFLWIDPYAQGNECMAQPAKPKAVGYCNRLSGCKLQTPASDDWVYTDCESALGHKITAPRYCMSFWF